MSLLKINDRAVLRGLVTFRQKGTWHARLSVDGGDALSGAVTITSALGDATLKGTAALSGSFAKRVDVFVVGGAGGFGNAIGSKFYKAVPLKIPLTDALTEAGEKLSPTADTATLNTFLDHWARVASSAKTAVETLLASTGASWRVLDDGTIWCGPETWPIVTPQFSAIDEATDIGAALIGPVGFALRPGTTFNGRHVTQVEYIVEPERIRAWVRYEASANEFRAAVETIVRRMLEPTLYHGTYSATVISQASNGHLDLKVDDARIPNPTDVPIRYGLPGVKATVTSGARCRVGFENGDAKTPYAYGFDESAGYTEIQFVDGPIPGTFPVARATIDTAGPYPITGGYTKIKLPIA